MTSAAADITQRRDRDQVGDDIECYTEDKRFGEEALLSRAIST